MDRQIEGHADRERETCEGGRKGNEEDLITADDLSDRHGTLSEQNSGLRNPQDGF